MSLRTGTELINLCLLINKLAGLYGLLAILTGYHLSGMQISMYIYSIVALGLAAHLSAHIRRGASSPLENLALAWLHLIDAVVSTFYTAAFGIGWFMVLAEHQGQDTTPTTIPTGEKMMSDVAGFNNPSYTATAVEVVVTSPASGAHNMPPEQAGHLVGHPADVASQFSGIQRDISPEHLLPSGSSASITTICILWLIRIYFILVVMAYARAVLRQHIVNVAQQTTGYAPPTQPADNGALYAEDPFRETPGWRGKLGRFMIRVSRSYWLGVEPGETARSGNEAHTAEWARSLTSKFDRRKGSQSVDLGTPTMGTGEREHRRRAGTGPPLLKPIELENVRK